MFLYQKNKLLPVLGVITLLLMGAGCASQTTAGKGADAVKHANWDAAVYYYLEALSAEPDNVEYRMALVRARQKAAQEHFRRGATLRDLGRLSDAVKELEMAVQLDPTHQFAEQVLKKARADLEVLSQPDGEKTLEEMKQQAREAKVKPPVLDPSSDEPITLNFPKAKPVKEIYKAISKAYGFNVLFDPKLKDDDLAVELNDVRAERALEIVMQASGHFYKVLDEHSIIVVEDSPQNRREYEDLVIKTFFLSNADVKEVDKLLRSLIEARRLATNEQLNAITLRDTADKVAIAEKLIAVNDKAKAEVLVAVELLEANANNIQELGAKLTTQTFSLVPDLDLIAGGSENHQEGSLYLDQLSSITRSAFSLTVPSVIINLVKSSSEATSLAQPQMRITEGEKGALVIGDRIPIPVTTFNTSNSVGSNVVPITSFQYQDVGIRIDVEPRVHHNREVTLKVTVEVSSVAGTVTQNNQEQPIIGTRNIDTVIRLREGETSMLVGLYKKDTSIGKDELPGLSRIPLLGRLFTNKSEEVQVKDLVLTLTPHILRFPDIREEDLAPLWVGTESRISFFGATSPRVHSGSANRGPFDRSNRDAGSGGDKDSEKAESPYHTARGPALRRGDQVRRPTNQPGDQPNPGVDLVPSGGKTAAVVDDRTDEAVDPSVDGAPPALSVGFDPAMVSLRPGETTVLQVVAGGSDSSYRLPLSLTFNSQRMQIDSVATPSGVWVADQVVDEQGGWLGLDLVVPSANELPRAVASITVRGLEPGPVPLILTVGSARDDEGQPLAVATSDGALFVIDDGNGGL